MVGPASTLTELTTGYVGNRYAVIMIKAVNRMLKMEGANFSVKIRDFSEETHFNLSLEQ